MYNKSSITYLLPIQIDKYKNIKPLFTETVLHDKFSMTRHVMF